MKYLVDIVATVKIEGVMIDVGEFNPKEMTARAVEVWRGSLRAASRDLPDSVEVIEAVLENWDSRD